MYKISVEGHFSAAHFLEDYKGLCGSVHGHRWTVKLSLTTQALGRGAMVADFSSLKSALNSIMDEMDHAFILDPEGNEASKEFYALAKKWNMRVFCFSGRTTAEHIAKYVYDRIKEELGWTTHSVIVYEAPTNCVEYSEE